MKLLTLICITCVCLANNGGDLASISVSDTGCGICTWTMTISDTILPNNVDNLVEKDDWVGIFCDMLPVTNFDIDMDVSGVEINDRAPGIYAFGQIKANNQVGFSFMGVYENQLIDREDDEWTTVFDQISQFDSTPKITIKPNSVTFEAVAVQGHSNAFGAGNKFFRCQHYKSKKVINYSYYIDDGTWSDDFDIAVNLHQCKSKSQIEQENNDHSGTNKF